MNEVSLSLTVDEITLKIAPIIQSFMVEHKEELIAAGHFGPIQRAYITLAYPHYVGMVPIIVRSVVKSVLDLFHISVSE